MLYLTAEGEILAHAINDYNSMILTYLLLLVLSSMFIVFLRFIVRILGHIVYYQKFECAIDCSYCLIIFFFLILLLLHLKILQIIFNVLYVINENEFNMPVCNQRSLTAASGKQLLVILISVVDALRLVHKIMIRFRIRQNSQKFLLISCCSSVILVITINMVQYYNVMLKDSVYYDRILHHDLFNVNASLYYVTKKNEISEVGKQKKLQRHDEGEQVHEFMNIVHNDINIVAFEECACFKCSIRFMVAMISIFGLNSMVEIIVIDKIGYLRFIDAYNQKHTFKYTKWIYCFILLKLVVVLNNFYVSIINVFFKFNVFTVPISSDYLTHASVVLILFISIILLTMSVLVYVENDMISNLVMLFVLCNITVDKTWSMMAVFSQPCLWH